MQKCLIYSVFSPFSTVNSAFSALVTAFDFRPLLPFVDGFDTICDKPFSLWNSSTMAFVFWKIYPIEEVQEDGTKTTKNIPLLKYINVFHISQVDGVEPLKKEELNDIEPIEKAKKILTDYWNREHIKVEHIKGNKAFYSPSMNYIQLPLFEQFKQSEEYYSTAFHESVHSTMKESRCNRAEERKNKLVAFGSEEYSKEELVAEIGSANLMNIIGIETKKSFRNSTAYIQSWLRVLRNDNKFIVSASSKAEKAVEYILNEA